MEKRALFDLPQDSVVGFLGLRVWAEGCDIKLDLNPGELQITRFDVIHSSAQPRQKSSQLAEDYVKTTMIYTHVLNRGGKGVRSPADTF